MNNCVTPEKRRIHVQPGNIAINSKWKDTHVYTGLKSFFNSVKIFDNGSFDFYLSKHNILYLNQKNMLSDINANAVQKLGPDILIIADRNTSTINEYSKLQESLFHAGLSVIPVGNSEEVPLLLYQLNFSEMVYSPASSFKEPVKPPPDIHLQILLNVPTLGQAKARKLLDAFGTVQKVAFASIKELDSVVGAAAASHTHNFFNELVNR